MPALVDTDRLEVRADEQIALSPHPDRAGSRGWGALFPRVAVVATLRDRATGAMFTAIGTHLDHVSGRARRKAARQLSDLVLRGGLPAVLMGDLNAGADAPALRHLTGEGGLRDAWQVAATTASPELGTRPGYRAPQHRGRRIDHILVTPGIEVARVGANTSGFDGRRPSDHLPVQAAVRIAQREEHS
ncbi:MAG: hydrolase [Microbacterium sp.]|nr:MAG: hydrolase [Microbacterium sp.]